MQSLGDVLFGISCSEWPIVLMLLYKGSSRSLAARGGPLILAHYIVVCLSTPKIELVWQGLESCAEGFSF